MTKKQRFNIWDYEPAIAIMALDREQKRRVAREKRVLEIGHLFFLEAAVFLFGWTLGDHRFLIPFLVALILFWISDLALQYGERHGF